MEQAARAGVVAVSWDSAETAKAVRDKRAEREEALRRDAIERARLVSAFLKQEYGVSKVVLYGSLAEGFFHEKSDIDLLIDEFTGSYWDMYAKADRMASPFHLSIVCARDAKPSLLENAESGG